MAKKQSDEDILETARARYDLARDAEQLIRKEARIDLDFCAGRQWSDGDRQMRESGNQRRPCLTFNKLIGPLNMVANDARQNTPGIEVHPVDSVADPDTADVIEGMIRHIEYTSKADEVYDTALEQSTAGGFGYFRVNKRYCCAESFDMELYLERIVDPFSVYIDPFARQADKSDMRWAIELEVIPKDDYRRDYPDSEMTQMNFFDGGINPIPNWVSDEGVLIARYWDLSIEKKKLMLIQWPDGKTTAMLDDDLPDQLPPGLKFATDEKGKPIERDTDVRKVTCYKINGLEILDQTDWEGQWIPILPVLGKEMVIDGRRELFSLVRFARDAQRLYNFYRSSEAETVALGTKAPWVGVKGMFRDPRWASANVIPWAYLEYEPLDIAGNPAPPPMRNAFEPPIQALTAGAAQASDDIKATTNVYDPSLGVQSNETSGVAIRQRQGQSGLSNFHFVDNLNRAIRHAGEILVDLIPKIYDTAREIRILGEDRTQQIVKVNQQYRDEKGRDRCYDLSLGKYDVTIQVGPSYATQRQAAFDTLTQIAQAYPQLVQIAGDIIFDNADMPGAKQIADRLRRSLPPGLQDQPDGPQALQAAAAQMQQMGQTIDQLTATVNQQNQEILMQRAKAESHERLEYAKIESSDRQAALKAQVDLVNGEMKVKSTEDIALLRAQISAIEAQIGRMASGQAAQAAEGAPPPPPPAWPAPSAPAPPQAAAMPQMQGAQP